VIAFLPDSRFVLQGKNKLYRSTRAVCKEAECVRLNESIDIPEVWYSNFFVNVSDGIFHTLRNDNRDSFFQVISSTISVGTSKSLNRVQSSLFTCRSIHTEMLQNIFESVVVTDKPLCVSLW
jgi:hypothetical protein